MNILVINGPNLNMLGIREVDVYGRNTYEDLVNYLSTIATQYNINLEVFQTNSEEKIINKLHEAYFKKVDGIIINPAAFTHYSYAIYDAIKAINIKTVEVHLSNIYEREDFRKINVIKDACVKSFYGKGFLSYKEALLYLIGEEDETSKRI